MNEYKLANLFINILTVDQKRIKCTVVLHTFNNKQAVMSSKKITPAAAAATLRKAVGETAGGISQEDIFECPAAGPCQCTIHRCTVYTFQISRQTLM